MTILITIGITVITLQKNPSVLSIGVSLREKAFYITNYLKFLDGKDRYIFDWGHIDACAFIFVPIIVNAPLIVNSNSTKNFSNSP